MHPICERSNSDRGLALGDGLAALDHSWKRTPCSSPRDVQLDPSCAGAARHVARNEEEASGAEGPRSADCSLFTLSSQRGLPACSLRRVSPSLAGLFAASLPSALNHISQSDVFAWAREGPLCLSDYWRCSSIIAGFVLTREMRLAAERPAGGYYTPDLNLSPLMILSTE